MVVDVNESGNQRIAFDIGSTPIFDDAVAAAFVFISHGHLDHIGRSKFDLCVLMRGSISK